MNTVGRGSTFGAGFTLVELLVVMAIISILAALLMPVLKSALDTAHTVECMSREKQMGVAFSFYFEDYGGWVPWVYTEGDWNMPPMSWYPNAPWSSQYFRNTFSNMPGQLMEYELGRQYPFNADPRESAARFWQCPELPLGLKSSTAAYFNPVTDEYELKYPYVTLWAERQRYAMNIWLNAKFIPGAPRDWARQSDIRQPFKTVLIAESDGQKGHDDWIVYDHAAGGPGYCLGERHAGRTKGNVLFFDSHVETLLRQETKDMFKWN